MAPSYVVQKLVAALNQHQRKAVNGSKILIIGMAYKKNVEDTRESPAFNLIDQLESAGGEVEFHDPYVPVIPHMREHANMVGRKSVMLTEAIVSQYDAVLICTDHDNVDYDVIGRSAKMIIDTRNAMAKVKPSNGPTVLA
jgi:UDP-N-acetyl-D-glucosamine dehydrogenase